MTTLIVFCAGAATGYLAPPVGKFIVDKTKLAYDAISLWLATRKK
jgi:hypothetical protein